MKFLHCIVPVVIMLLSRTTSGLELEAISSMEQMEQERNAQELEEMAREGTAVAPVPRVTNVQEMPYVPEDQLTARPITHTTDTMGTQPLVYLLSGGIVTAVLTTIIVEQTKSVAKQNKCKDKTLACKDAQIAQNLDATSLSDCERRGCNTAWCLPTNHVKTGENWTRVDVESSSCDIWRHNQDVEENGH